ncbi:MAG: hypothetical protein Q9222_003103 [Ikaeria aurantiellina]
MPAIRQGKSRASSDPPSAASELDIFMIDPSSEPLGAPISFGNTQLATLTGVAFLNGKQHVLVPQHPRFDYHQEISEVLHMKNQLLEFDEDSDAEEDEDIDIMMSDEDSIFDTGIHESKTPVMPDLKSHQASFTPEATRLPRIDCANQFDPIGSRIHLATLSDDVAVNNLDYECLPVSHNEIALRNRLRLPTAIKEAPRYLYPDQIASKPEESAVLAMTGTTGLIKGTMLESPYYIKMPGSSKCQEMWPVRFERETRHGDCGAWVVNAVTGMIYDHIVAGDPHNGMAYIIPAYKVFEDIKGRFGTQPSLYGDDSNV